MKNFKNFIINQSGLNTFKKQVLVVVFTLITGLPDAAFSGVVTIEPGNAHPRYHGNPGGYGNGHGHGGYRHYGRRGYYYPPNVIITVPTPRYYAPLCEEVEVCNPYGQCWLEQRCN